VPRVKYTKNHQPRNSFSMSYALRKVIFPGVPFMYTLLYDQSYTQSCIFLDLGCEYYLEFLYENVQLKQWLGLGSGTCRHTRLVGTDSLCL
jgi:hypothetical protein